MITIDSFSIMRIEEVGRRFLPYNPEQVDWLPPSVHSDSRDRVWQRRFYPYSVYSEKKRLEKLNYVHNNPVKRGLVSSPEEWPWSSFRFYYLADSSLLSMDRAA